MILLFFTVIAAYLLGSIPSAVWLGRALKGVDLRDHGSGNAGATNAFRVLGTPIGIAVLLLDMGKGYLAVSLVRIQDLWLPGSEGYDLFRIGLGLVAVLGHIFPVFARFRGGKGVATLAGIGLALNLPAAGAAFLVYGLVFYLSRLSALGSLIAVTSYPFWMILVFPAESLALRVFSVAVPLLVYYTHRANIGRLIRGEENRVFRGKQGDPSGEP
ncbi:MAG: glycerol-3-phosphate 1-O-acyltransferase PlsY [Bacteroidales bacterium]